MREENRTTAGRMPFTRRALRVVMAEDEALPAELLKRTILRLGHVVVGSAQNGAEAIALARELEPDVVLMDLRMPVMDGWTAMAELTRAGIAPVVVVSALEDRAAVEQAMAAGASGYLTKPVRGDDLERALELAVARFADFSRAARAKAPDAASSPAEAARRIQELETLLQTARAQLARAAQRAAVTSLAHGLAHEINNALTPVVGHAQMIELAHAQEPETLQRAHLIIEHAQRIAGWSASFRQITLRAYDEPIPFSFNGVAEEVFALYGARFERLGIAAGLDLDMTLPVMTGYPDQLQEALLLLIQNAMEAQQGGGAIRLKTRALSETAHVLVILSDTGSGIAPEHLPFVFEPGFTTKKGGARALLGWGLYAAKLIATANHGTIEISSPDENSTRGTSVRVELPFDLPAAT